MPRLVEAHFWKDARHYQIAALATLVIFNLGWIDFGAQPGNSALALAACLITQIVCSRRAGLPLDLRSPLITGLSLSLLLRADEPWLHALAGVIAVGSKFVLRLDGKHIWNPAGLAIVVLLFTAKSHVWISPGAWGSTVWFAALLGFFAIIVLGAARRSDIAVFFIASHAALLTARALWLGDPLTIPLHQLQSGSLLIFTFFMISDPRTSPDSRLGRFVFAFSVAVLAHYMTFFMQMRPALYVALIALSPLTILIDRLWPAEKFSWRPGPARSLRMKKVLHSSAAVLAILAQLAAQSAPAGAFCGFYVAKADSKLFNKSSKVVLTRDGETTAITMASDYEGSPKEFAVVIPVPTFIERKQIGVVEMKTVDHLDAYTAPRLVEYHDEDPCNPPVYMARRSAGSAMPATPLAMASADPRYKGVTVEANYDVGEYDVSILSAKESDGLTNWLTDNGYRIPQGAEAVLGSYIKQNMRFFVAKVNLERMQLLGGNYLRPLQVRYDTAKFMLPLRLGTVNANGPQDLIIYALTKNGRVEAANYPTVKLPSDMDVPLFVKNDFGNFYRAVFDTAVKKENMRAVFVEYAWDMGWCDPCAADPLSNKQLVELGARWISDDDDKPFRGRMAQGANAYVTRLHVRYDAQSFPEDLTFIETKDRSNFQGRYVLRHPFAGTAKCEAGEKYRAGLPERFKREAVNLSRITGWKQTDVETRMEHAGQSLKAGK